MTYRNQFVVDLGANALYANSAMYGKGEIERGRTYRQHLYITFGCVYINFFRQETCFKVLQEIHAICLLVAQHFSDLLKPLDKAAFIAGAFFIFIMRSQ